jgi:hypothetical protein
MRKRLGYVVMAISALIGVGFNLNDVVSLIDGGLPTPIWTAISLALFFIGVFAVISYKDPEETKLKQPIINLANNNNTPRIKLNRGEDVVLDNLCYQMESKHGYADREAIKRELLKNRSNSEIMADDCSICGIPRNQEGYKSEHVWR